MDETTNATDDPTTGASRRGALKKIALGAAGAGALLAAQADPAAAAPVDGNTDTIQIRRQLSSAWTSGNPILAAGEVGLEIDTGRVKVGNGLSHPMFPTVLQRWNDLPYVEDSRFADHLNEYATLDGLTPATSLEDTDMLLVGRGSTDDLSATLPTLAGYLNGGMQFVNFDVPSSPRIWDRASSVVVVLGATAADFVLPGNPYPVLRNAYGIRVIQSSTGKARFMPENSTSSPVGYQLTANPTLTRLRTKGQWAVATVLPVPSPYGTAWVISGDVEAV